VPRQTVTADRAYLIPLSARSENALKDLARAFADYLSDGAVSLDDLCYTAAVRRNHYDHRLAVTARSCGEARELLTAFGRGEVLPGVATGHVRVRNAEVPVLTSLEREDGPGAGLHDALGTLYVRGHRIDWHRLYNRGGTCLRLPTYPWQRKRFWVDLQAPAAAGVTPEAAGQALGWMDSGPVRRRADLNVPYVAPRTELERHLADLWAKTLHIDRVGVHDNFLELGGNSLQAAALSNRLQQQIGVTLSPVALFEAQTIHDLAAYLHREYPAAVAQLLATADRPLPTAVPSVSQGQDTEALLAQLAELSDGEVDALLQQSLADREKDDA
jgi:acyl transferase domain-containing protein